MAARLTDESNEEAARALADELRRAIGLLVDTEPTADSLAQAHGLATRLCEALSGPRRPRWYDAGYEPSGPTPEARRSYLTQSPVRGGLNPVAPPLVATGWVDRDDGRRVLCATAHLGVAYEGPPHGVHGGWVAALFDDLLGQAQEQAEKSGVTATLQVRYRHLTPLDEDLHLEAWIHEDRGRRITARATCHAGDVLTADAEAIFVAVDFEEVRARMLSRRDSSGS
jgi:acyl-coenzyme A thioesterase PaaI-like protein